MPVSVWWTTKAATHCSPSISDRAKLIKSRIVFEREVEPMPAPTKSMASSVASSKTVATVRSGPRGARPQVLLWKRRR